MRAIAEVVESCQFILGPKVEAFEDGLCGLLPDAFCFRSELRNQCVASGAARGGVGPGDEVITVSYTFVATVAGNTLHRSNAGFRRHRSAHLQHRSAKIEAAITPKTKVIMPVHLYGTCADMDPILEIARRHNLIVVEDAAQAARRRV